MSHLNRNSLYRGTGYGHFEKITEGSIVTDAAATCGIAWQAELGTLVVGAS
jgi:hypothetical protein